MRNPYIALALLLISSAVFFQSSSSSAYSYSGTYSNTKTSPGTATPDNGSLVINDSQILISSSYTAGSTQMPLGIMVYAKKGYASVYVAAFYNNVWYFWDQTKAPTNRWVAIPNINTAASFPEVSVGSFPDYYSKVLTEIIPSAHGAAIHVGVGFGYDPVSRKNEMMATKRFRYIRSIP